MSNLFIVPNKKMLILLIILISGIFFITLIILISTPSSQITASPSPSPVRVTTPTTNLPNLPENTPTSAYSSQDLERDFQRMKNRELSVSDLEIRDRLISSLGNKTGYLLKTPDYLIEYVKAPDIFMIEILSEDAESVKEEALKWFIDQGLSSDGICSLPVMVYLNFEITEIFNQTNQTFNPVPEICQ